MTARSILILFSVTGVCLSQHATYLETQANIFSESCNFRMNLQKSFPNMQLIDVTRIKSCPEDVDCYLDFSIKSFDRYDHDKDGCLSKDEVKEMLELNIMAKFDIFDANNDGKIYLTLKENMFNIKVDFLTPHIELLYGKSFLLKPSYFLLHKIPYLNASETSSWTYILTKFSESLDDSKYKIYQDIIEGPGIEMIDLFDKNDDGYFNMTEITEASTAIVSLLDGNSNGKVTLDEVMNYIQKYRIISITELKEFKHELVSFVEMVDKLYNPLIVQLDTDNDKMISKAEAIDILNFRDISIEFWEDKEIQATFEKLSGKIMNPLTLIAKVVDFALIEGKEEVFQANVYEWATKSVEHLKAYINDEKENKEYGFRA